MADGVAGAGVDGSHDPVNARRSSVILPDIGEGSVEQLLVPVKLVFEQRLS